MSNEKFDNKYFVKKSVELLNEGQNKCEIFDLLSKELSVKVELTNVEDYFVRVKNRDLTLENEVEKEIHDLLVCISTACTIHSNSILKLKNKWGDIYSFYKNRYAICCKGKRGNNRFTIVDCWTGKTKIIKTAKKFELKGLGFWNTEVVIDDLYFVEPNYFVLVYDPRDCTEGTFLCLLSIDFEKMTCSYLDGHFLEQISQPKFIFDQENPHKFIVNEDTWDRLQLVEILNNKFQISFCVGKVFSLTGMRLRNNNVSGFKFEYVTEGKGHKVESIAYNEHEFKDLPNERRNENRHENDDYYHNYEYYPEYKRITNESLSSTKINFDIDFEEGVYADFSVSNYRSYKSEPYSWANNICYFLIHVKSTAYYVCAIDVDTNKMTYLGICIGKSIRYLSAGKNGSLLVLVDKCLLRFQLGEIDSLEQMTWFAMRRKELFNNGGKDKCLNLPLNNKYRSFYDFP